MTGKVDRPVDKRRDSAFSIKVGLPEEGKITGLFKLGEEELLIIKERAVYEIMMADRIDPERRNARIPNIQRRVFDQGSDDKTIQSMLIQTSVFTESHFLEGVDTVQIGRLAVACCAEALAMHRICERVKRNQTDAFEPVKGTPLVEGFILPTLHDLEQDVKSALNRADHCGSLILNMSRKFLGKVTSFESLLSKEKVAGAETPESLAILENLVRFLRFVRETRNSMEHPSAERHIEVVNFELDPDGALVAPTFGHVHPKYPQPTIAITTFLDQMHESLLEVYVLWISRLVSQKAHAGGAPILVMPLPDDRRKFPHVRYGFGLNTRDGLVPFG
jgi:hypothetical protein